MTDDSITQGGVDDFSLINQPDIVTFGNGLLIWIHGTQPMIQAFGDLRAAGPVQSSFPFARLASAEYQGVTYIYHQINGTTFAEEQWNGDDRLWGTTEYVNVSEL